MHKVSATQVKTFKLCPRKWAWQYIAGHRSPETAAKAIGSKVHEILEAYLKGDATPAPDYTWQFEGKGPVKYPGKIALQMINAHLPQPGKAIVEGKTDFDYNGIRYTAIIDCHSLDRSAMGQTAVVIDHKTSSDPKKWGMSDKDLEHDPQALLYAVCMLEKYPDLGLVNCLWNYGSTKAIAAAAYVARCAMTPKIARARFAEHVEPFAKLILRHKKRGTDPLEMTFNADACGVFGGCEHVGRCKLTDKERIGAFVMGTSLVDQLIKEAAKENARPEEKAVEKAATEPEKAATEPEQPEPSPHDGVNPPEAQEPLAPEPLGVESLPVASKPAKGKKGKKAASASAMAESVAAMAGKSPKKQKKKESPMTESPRPASPASEPIKAAAASGQFDALLDEMIDILAERAVARLIQRMRETLKR